MKPSTKSTDHRVAFSPAEFAALFGRSQTWGYRQVYKGSVKAITTHGRMMIPAAEVDRILGDAGIYKGLKPKVPKKGPDHSGWKKFLEQRRSSLPARAGTKTARSSLPTPGGPKAEAISRLIRREFR